MLVNGRDRQSFIGTSFQFSSAPLPIWSSAGHMMDDDPAEILFQSFLQGAVVSTSGMGRVSIL